MGIENDKTMDVHHKPKVSIGIAVFNVEKYLNVCLDSIIGQTLKDIEIIIIDDGSTDSSGRICDEYAKKDGRITVVHKSNGGLASARQAALEVSKGQFFCACDADDWVEPDMYEHLYQKAIETGADIVMCDYWSEYPDGHQQAYNYPYIPDEREDLLDDLLNGRFPQHVWSKIFRRDLFEKYSISWEPGVNLGEDFLLMLKILQNPVKIECVKRTLYHYSRVLGGKSYTNNITLNTFKQSLFIRHWVMDNVDNLKYANGIFRLWLALGFTALRVKEGINNNYYSSEIMSHLSYRGFLKYSYPKLKGLIVFSAKLFGYEFAENLYKMTYRFVYK